MQAIVTRYHPWTSHRCAYYTATAQAKTIKRSIGKFSSDSDPLDCHRHLAEDLLAELGWSHYGNWISAGLPNGDMVWVCDNVMDPKRDIIAKVEEDDRDYQGPG